jgi:uncharacterized membrane protein YphA (DoxX/SURF4 family)
MQVSLGALPMTRKTPFHLSGPGAPVRRTVMRLTSISSNNLGAAAILFCFVFLYLVFAGPGAWSVDDARRGRLSAST